MLLVKYRVQPWRTLTSPSDQSRSLPFHYYKSVLRYIPRRGTTYIMFKLSYFFLGLMFNLFNVRGFMKVHSCYKHAGFQNKPDFFLK